MGGKKFRTDYTIGAEKGGETNGPRISRDNGEHFGTMTDVKRVKKNIVIVEGHGI